MLTNVAYSRKSSIKDASALHKNSSAVRKYTLTRVKKIATQTDPYDGHPRRQDVSKIALILHICIGDQQAFYDYTGKQCDFRGSEPSCCISSHHSSNVTSQWAKKGLYTSQNGFDRIMRVLQMKRFSVLPQPWCSHIGQALNLPCKLAYLHHFRPRPI